MFAPLPAPGHVVAMHLSGKLTADDVKQYKDAFEAALAAHRKVGICVDLTGFADMSAAALVADFKVEMGLLAHLDQIGRCAVVSDKEWPQAIIQLVAPIFPGFEMRVFPPDRRDAAIAWAAILPEAAPALPAIRFLPTTGPNLLAFEINGMISAAEMPGVLKTFDTFLAGHEKVRMLNRLTHFGGIDPAIFLQGGLIATKLTAIRKVERYAIIGAPGWMSQVIGMMSPALAAMEIRLFPTKAEPEAWAWLEAEPIAA